MEESFGLYHDHVLRHLTNDHQSATRCGSWCRKTYNVTAMKIEQSKQMVRDSYGRLTVRVKKWVPVIDKPRKNSFPRV